MRKRREICSKLTIKTPERRLNDVVLVFLLLTMNMFHIFSSVCLVDFKQVTVACRMHYLTHSLITDYWSACVIAENLIIK